MKKKISLIFTVLLCVNFLGVSAWAAAESVADFYRDNTVTLIVGSDAGSGADLAARVVANSWNEVTGGTMVVRNMAGAAGLVGMNYMAAARPDGLTLGFMMYTSAFLLPHLTHNPAQTFDITKLNYLISVFNEPMAMVLSMQRPYRTIEDLQKAKGLKMGAQAPYEVGTYAAVPFISFLNLDLKIVTGYAGAAEKSLAVGKGEVDMELAPLAVTMRGHESGYNTLPVVIMADERIPFLPDIPAFPEIVDMTPEQRKIYEGAVYGAGFVTRMIAAQEGVDPEKVAYLRDAFAKVMASQKLQEEAKLLFPYGVSYIAHEELDAFVASSLTIDVEELTALLDTFLAVH